jgi:glycosyltransferase involved in cell wall biosynthesis
MFAYETNGFPHVDWKFGLSLMDKVLVSCNYQKDAVHNTCGKDVSNKTSIVPHPVDVSKFDKEWEPIDFEIPTNTVKFYTIAEFNKRKNIVALLVAYYTAFDHNDNVSLILKTNLGDDTREFEGFCESLKKDMGRFANPNYYPKIALVPHRLKDEHINSLHCTGDIFVTASHGEAICLPLLDAMGFGKPAIVPKHSAFLDYAFDGDYDLLVESHESISFGVNDAPEGLYTCDERWGNPNLPALASKMRQAYTSIKDLTSSDRVKNRIEYVKDVFSYKAVGTKLKEEISATK